ncbi:MAG TPA: precorrin-2 C(20)-methyltransferase [Bacilli bacterium]|nr:precorrin-2 C(20)-methyltransferase [Bacilli bacterium]
MLGKVYGVGVGPGDPELITVKAYRIMKEADVVAFPKKRRGSKSYAQQIIDHYVNPAEKEMLPLVFPMTREQDILETEWTNVAVAVYEKVKEGKDVAFITEGDPLLYSTFIHLMKRLNQLYPEVECISIPGISSVNAAASRFMTPLADGDDWFAIVPATEDREQMRKALNDHDAVVFLKVAKVLPQMIDLLEEMNLVDKAVVTTKVTSVEELVWHDVRELKTAELNYLSLMLVRK